MSYIGLLVPIGILLGLAGLGAFLWSLRSGQYDDLDGAAQRILMDDELDGPLPGEPSRELRPAKDENPAGAA